MGNHLSSSKVKRLLRLAIEHGYIDLEKLNDEDKAIVKRLVSNGYLKPAVIPNHELLPELLNLVKPRVVMLSFLKLKIVKYLCIFLTPTIPAYFTIKAILVGKLSSIIFFAIITLLVMYLSYRYLCRRICKAIL